jgi:hypothetical protein
VATTALGTDLPAQMRALMWEPRYLPVRPG